jgi:hypothetical protein
VAGSLVLVVILAAAALCMLWLHWAPLKRATSDREWLPKELHGAELVWSEKSFGADRPVALSARIDRAYRLPGGELVLVEFKRRDQRRVHLPDVVELSAQRYALQHAGHFVSQRAYVVVILPDGTRTLAIPAELQDAAEVELRTTRLQALIELRLAPRGAGRASVCMSCGHRAACPLHAR